MSGNSDRVYRDTDGAIVYKGPPWKKLSVEARTARIKECYALGYYSQAKIAGVLEARDNNGTCSVGAINGHLFRNKIAHPGVPRERRPVKACSSLKRGVFQNETLSGEKRQVRAQRRSEYGLAVIARMEAEDTQPVDEVPRIGYCTKEVKDPITRQWDTCGDFTGDLRKNRCTKHE